MQAQCIREKLRGAISTAEHATGRNLSLPVLSAVLIKAEKEHLVIKATNLDIGVSITVPAKVEREGVIAIPGGVLNHFLSAVRDETISLTEKGGNLSVETASNATLIKAVPHDDFPTIPQVRSENVCTLPADQLSGGLRSVWYAAATSDIKPEIASVYTASDNGTLVFAATDSFRLAEKKFSLKAGQNIPQFLIPIKNAGELIRIFEGRDGEVEIAADQSQASFEHENVYVTSRLIDGVFPDYKQIIPSEFSSEVIVLKNDLLNALKLTTLFADRFNQITFSLEPKSGTCALHAENADVGENTTKLDATLSGEELKMSFNHKYIMDALGVIPTDSIALRFSGEGRPLVLGGVGDQNFLYLVMPLNS